MYLKRQIEHRLSFPALIIVHKVQRYHLTEKEKKKLL